MNKQQVLIYQPYSQKPVIDILMHFETKASEQEISELFLAHLGWKRGLSYADIKVIDVTDNEMLEIHDAHLSLNGVHIKTFRTVLDKNDTEYDNIKKNVSMWFNLTHNTHYNEIKTELVNKIENTEKMAKKTLTQNVEAEEATTEQQATETGLIAVDLLENKINLPAITKEFTLGGVKISTDLIKKEVAKVLKMTLSSPSDKAKYEEIKAENQKLVKTRTSTKKAREEACRPITNWVSNLKKTVQDDIAEALKPGEDHCKAQMEIYENWEAEEKKKEEAATEARLKERSQLLSNIQGVKNFDSGHWSFPYAPHLIIEQSSLESEFGWDDAYEEIKKEFEDYSLKKSEEEKKSSQMAESLINSRKMILEMMSYTEANGNYLLNGHVVTPNHIKDLTDAEWKELINSHKVAKKQETNPFAALGGGSSTPAPTPNDNVAPTTFSGGIFTTSEPAKTTNPFEIAIAETANTNVQVVHGQVTNWGDKTFVDHRMPNTTLRIFPTELKEEAVTPDLEIGIQGSFDINLSFIIFKNK